MEKARAAVGLLNRVLDPATPDELPEHKWTPQGVAAAVWYRPELRLLLKDLDPNRAE